MKSGLDCVMFSSSDTSLVSFALKLLEKTRDKTVEHSNKRLAFQLLLWLMSCLETKDISLCVIEFLFLKWAQLLTIITKRFLLSTKNWSNTEFYIDHVYLKNDQFNLFKASQSTFLRNENSSCFLICHPINPNLFPLRNPCTNHFVFKFLIAYNCNSLF